MKKYTASCFHCEWSGEWDTKDERATDMLTHANMQKHKMIAKGTVPDDILELVNRAIEQGYYECSTCGNAVELGEHCQEC